MTCAGYSLKEQAAAVRAHLPSADSFVEAASSAVSGRGTGLAARARAERDALLAAAETLERLDMINKLGRSKMPRVDA